MDVKIVPIDGAFEVSFGDELIGIASSPEQAMIIVQRQIGKLIREGVLSKDKLVEMGILEHPTRN